MDQDREQFFFFFFLAWRDESERTFCVLSLPISMGPGNDGQLVTSYNELGTFHSLSFWTSLWFLTPLIILFMSDFIYYHSVNDRPSEILSLVLTTPPSPKFQIQITPRLLGICTWSTLASQMKHLSNTTHLPLLIVFISVCGLSPSQKQDGILEFAWYKLSWYFSHRILIPLQNMSLKSVERRLRIMYSCKSAM